ncbi:TLR4 interactor with leucine rich repeats [Pseudolycoriella hygida]|uniref:TLR4 interactor with leucine rich repeats n=1 Tax=Pseudolycoriella hygida TaxID=35572 RepID=A0A9Q0MYV4_9DIPT|nr:TLR4 interactor with leucine rich repeats [Pseudolycoriella hygida]
MIGFILIAVVIACSSVKASDTWENVHIICPNSCVCQQSHFMDLSIARWIQTRQSGYDETAQAQTNENEAYYENDMSHTFNPFIKFAMCMLTDNGNIKNLLISLPQDVEALVLLYSGDNKNVSISTTDLQTLSYLTTLEIRGTSTSQVKFFLDEPLDFLKYVNFENIELFGTEKTKRRSNPSHPSELFDYVPESEREEYNISLEINEEVEIVPYEVYLIEKQMSQMPTFYGWSDLTVLRIHNCKLNELQWEMFDGLSNLEHLSLEHNGIKIVPPFALYGAPQIKMLSLARNAILDFNYRSLAGLLKLEWLDVSRNNLTKLSELSFPPFPNVEVVDFRYNPISHIYPMTFGVMNNTIHMFIGSDISSLDLSYESSFGSLDHLRTLILSNVTIPVLNQKVFKGLKSITKLTMQGQIRRIEFDAFAEMPMLKELYLSRCKIREISMDIFYGIRNLEIVDLSSNELFFLPNGLFDEQKKIKEIYLQNNLLTDLPTRFFDIPSVKFIRLTENPWTCSCKLQQWKQGITNKKRSGKIPKKCVKDFQKREVHCTGNDDEYSYVFDNKLSPRCDQPEDMKGRSVYYALRKNTKCTMVGYAKPVNATSEVIRMKVKAMEEFVHKSFESKGKKSNPMKKQRQDQFKAKYRKSVQNNIEYLLSQKEKRINEVKNEI